MRIVSDNYVIVFFSKLWLHYNGKMLCLIDQSIFILTFNTYQIQRSFKIFLLFCWDIIHLFLQFVSFIWLYVCFILHYPIQTIYLIIVITLPYKINVYILTPSILLMNGNVDVYGERIKTFYRFLHHVHYFYLQLIFV